MNRTTTLIAVSTLFFACAGSAPAPPVDPPPPQEENRIPVIQGRGHESRFVDERIEGIEGVVTAVLSSGRSPGFWMQDLDGDGDEGTSDAIFVSTRDLDVQVAVGDAVSVTGTIKEIGREGSLTVTQVTSPEVTVVSNGNDLPALRVVGAKGRRIPLTVATMEMKSYEPNLAAIDFWESLEGMRVEIRDPVVVGPTSRFGDLVVLPDHGIGVKVRSTRGGVVLRDGVINPQRLFLDPRLVGDAPTVNVGDRFDGFVTGVVDYAFGNYRLLYTETELEATREAKPPEVTRLRGGEDRLTVATYNVLNLSAASDDARFQAVAKSIVENLGAPDVIGLQEMQDDSGPADDGVVSATRTFGRLIDAVVSAGGPGYDFRQIDPVDNQDGGQPGGNIRVGVLFNPTRVSFVDRGEGGAADATAVEGEEGAARLTLSPGRVDPSNTCFAGSDEEKSGEPSRKSLAAEMRFADRTFFVIVNHFKSKGGDDGVFGSTHPPTRPTEEQRTCQAEVIGTFAAEILAKEPDARVIVLGDMNEHEFRPPILRLVETSGLTNLMEYVVVANRYTFIFEGNSQLLDHILISPALLKDAEIDIVHVNVDRAHADAASDHDPVLARLRF